MEISKVPILILKNHPHRNVGVFYFWIDWNETGGESEYCLALVVMVDKSQTSL